VHNTFDINRLQIFQDGDGGEQETDAAVMVKLKEDDTTGAGPPESETKLIALRQNLRMEVIL
jgi:hypothetical protein